MGTGFRKRIRIAVFMANYLSSLPFLILEIWSTMASSYPVYKNLDEVMEARPEYEAQADYYAMYSR